MTTMSKNELITALKFETMRYNAMATLDEFYSLHATIMRAAVIVLEAADRKKRDGAA